MTKEDEILLLRAFEACLLVQVAAAIPLPNLVLAVLR
jgi:hypothetical protein